jgi:hypothetical protein
MTWRVIATQPAESMRWRWLIDDVEAAAIIKAGRAGRKIVCQRKTQAGYELVVREKP